MDRRKILKKISLIALISILMFSLIPMTNAGVPGHMRDRTNATNILLPWYWNDYSIEFSASEDLFFRAGWASNEEEIENDIAPKHPWRYKLFINDEEISLQRYDVKPDRSIGMLKFTYWYHIFGPQYFTEGGEYLLRFEFWVKRPYQGDEKDYWRIWVDYWGVYFPPGTEFSFEYYLNIVA
jgi:hypothetical protein